MKKLLVLLFLFVVVGAGLAVCGAGWMWWATPPGQSSPKVDFDVPEGASLGAVSDALASKGLLRWPLAFKAFVRYRHEEGKLKPGTYELDAGMLPREILAKLVKGDIKMTSFGFPEGINVWQLAERVHAAFPNVKAAEWKAAMTEPRNLEGLPAEAKSLEGYLFPDTYVLRPKATLPEIISAMRKTFERNLTPALLEAGAARGLSKHAIVTLASIIEKETGRGEERTRISAVFHNRIAKRMKLQTDPTVIYGIWERYDGNIRKRDLQLPTPYNTYLISGMPPGPIANPGRASLEAAVNPRPGNELYFVGKGDGTHQFSSTLEEHNKAVYEYQVKPFRQRNRR